MANIYTVIRIDEPDFGCEGLPDGAVYKDIVRIKDSSGNEKQLEIADAYLYENDIKTTLIDGVKRNNKHIDVQ